MATKNGNIRKFFPIQQQPKEFTDTITSAAEHINPQVPYLTRLACTSQAASKDDSMAPGFFAADGAGPTISLKAGRVIEDSDLDDSDGSDSSLEDIFQNRTPDLQGLATRTVTPKKLSRNLDVPRLALKTSPLPASVRYRYSMKMLVDTAKRHDTMQASMQRIQDLERQPNHMNDHKATQSGIIQSIVADQEDGQADRYLRAVERTEATRVSQVWSFFDFTFDAKESALADREPFPKDNALGPHKLLQSSLSRETSILSGFTKEAVTLGVQLPDEILLWMFRSIPANESSPELARAYVDILLHSEDQVTRLIGPEQVLQMLKSVGASEEALNSERTMKLMPSTLHTYEGKHWASVRSIVLLLGQLSTMLMEATRVEAFKILVRLCADAVILEQTSLLQACQSSLCQLATCMGDSAWSDCCHSICGTVTEATNVASLALHILQCLPGYDIRLHELRRRTASAVFLGHSDYTTNADLPCPAFETYKKQLGGPQFKINESTDYQQMAALISLLDIAIDDGKHIICNKLVSNDVGAFNESLDGLCICLKSIHDNINDAGAKYISRVDAKDVLQSLINRLTCAVRTTTKPRKGVFDVAGDGTEQITKQAALMDSIFMRKGNSTIGFAVDGSVVNL